MFFLDFGDLLDMNSWCLSFGRQIKIAKIQGIMRNQMVEFFFCYNDHCQVEL
jgi:hypothetical protein